jgi:hypothetical protein
MTSQSRVSRLLLSAHSVTVRHARRGQSRSGRARFLGPSELGTMTATAVVMKHVENLSDHLRMCEWPKLLPTTLPGTGSRRTLHAPLVAMQRT